MDHVVIMVHGIRDFGEWEDALDRELGKSGIVTVGIKYGYFDAFRFLFPGSWFRNAVIRKVAQRVREAQALYPNAQYSYLAHSFGTYVVGKMLLEDPSFRAHRIVFCGSVLPADFPIAQLRCNFSAPVLNDIGTKDYWPVLALSSTWGYGSAGATGFGQPNVKDRYHDHGHPGFLKARFAKTFWVPFFKSGEVIPGIVPTEVRYLVRLLYVVHLKYAALCALVLLASFWVWQRPDLSCTEKWLGGNEYQECFDSAKVDLRPIVVEGRRSWLNPSLNEFRAKWVPKTARLCFAARSVLSRANYAKLNGNLVDQGYEPPLSVRSFVDAGNTELVQAVWLYRMKEEDQVCPPGSG